MRVFAKIKQAKRLGPVGSARLLIQSALDSCREVKRVSVERKGRIVVALGLAIEFVFFVALLGTANQETQVQEWLADVRARYAGTTVRAAVAIHPSIEAMRKLIPEFEQATGIRVEFDLMEEGLIYDRFMLAHTAGTGEYDLVMNAVEWVPAFIAAGATEDLAPWLLDFKPVKTPSWFDFHDIMFGARSMAMYKGEIHGIPFAGTPAFLMYNKEIFEQCGVSEPPKTMDELVELARYFYEECGVYGIAFRTQRGWQFTLAWTNFMAPFGGAILNPEGYPILDSEGSKRGLKYMIELKQYAPPDIEDMNYPEVWDAMMTGNTAMILETSSAPPVLEDPTRSPVAGKIGYAPWPEGPAGAYTGLYGWSFSIASTIDEHQKGAAYATLVWLTSLYNQDKYLNAGGIPTRRSGLEDPQRQAENPHFKVLLEAYRQVGAWAKAGYLAVPKIVSFPKVTEVLGEYGSRAFVGEMSVEQATRICQEKVTQILKEAGEYPGESQ